MVFCFSDTEFDKADAHGTGLDMICRKYAASGYVAPALSSQSRSRPGPNAKRVSFFYLASGQVILKSLLSNQLDKYTPFGEMMER